MVQPLPTEISSHIADILIITVVADNNQVHCISSVELSEASNICYDIATIDFWQTIEKTVNRA